MRSPSSPDRSARSGRRARRDAPWKAGRATRASRIRIPNAMPAWRARPPAPVGTFSRSAARAPSRLGEPDAHRGSGHGARHEERDDAALRFLFWRALVSGPRPPDGPAAHRPMISTSPRTFELGRLLAGDLPCGSPRCRRASRPRRPRAPHDDAPPAVRAPGGGARRRPSTRPLPALAVTSPRSPSGENGFTRMAESLRLPLRDPPEVHRAALSQTSPVTCAVTGSVMRG